MICPICSSNNVKVLHSGLFDDRYGCPDVVDIKRCRNCFHCFASPNIDPASVASLYETYYGRETVNVDEVHKSALSSINSSRLSRWIKGTNNLGQYYSPRTGKLLDVGTGDCQNLLEAKLLGIAGIGFDVDSSSSVIANSLGLDVRTGKRVTDVLRDNDFDWIQLNQVVEHYVNPIQELQYLSPLIDLEGKIFISTPNSRSLFRIIFRSKWINWHVPYHQHHFSKKSIGICLENAGFKSVKIRTVTPLVWSQIQIATLGQKSTNGEPSKFWKSTDAEFLTNRQKSQSIKITLRKIRTGFRIMISSILIVLGRLVDSIRLGDSLVVIAVKSK